jgi:hypothetical protein
MDKYIHIEGENQFGHGNDKPKIYRWPAPPMAAGTANAQTQRQN